MWVWGNRATSTAYSVQSAEPRSEPCRERAGINAVLSRLFMPCLRPFANRRLRHARTLPAAGWTPGDPAGWPPHCRCLRCQAATSGAHCVLAQPQAGTLGLRLPDITTGKLPAGPPAGPLTSSAARQPLPKPTHPALLPPFSELPDALGQLSCLTSLCLDRNYMRHLPASLVRLRRLQHLR